MPSITVKEYQELLDIKASVQDVKHRAELTEVKLRAKIEGLQERVEDLGQKVKEANQSTGAIKQSADEYQIQLETEKRKSEALRAAIREVAGPPAPRHYDFQY